MKSHSSSIYIHTHKENEIHTALEYAHTNNKQVNTLCFSSFLSSRLVTSLCVVIALSLQRADKDAALIHRRIGPRVVVSTAGCTAELHRAHGHLLLRVAVSAVNELSWCTIHYCSLSSMHRFTTHRHCIARVGVGSLLPVLLLTTNHGEEHL